jgi:uncharacterized membrane protein YkgB
MVDNRGTGMTDGRKALRSAAPALGSLGAITLRYGLVVVVGWIGAMKFTAYEAAGIQPLIAESPLMSWLYAVLSMQGASNAIGVVELAAAAMIALRPLSPASCVVGSGLAVAMFLTTLTFLFSTPGWESTLGGFPAISAMPGQFLLKDLVLHGAALWSAGEAAAAAATEPIVTGRG